MTKENFIIFNTKFQKPEKKNIYKMSPELEHQTKKEKKKASTHTHFLCLSLALSLNFTTNEIA